MVLPIPMANTFTPLSRSLFAASQVFVLSCDLPSVITIAIFGTPGLAPVKYKCKE